MSVFRFVPEFVPPKKEVIAKFVDILRSIDRLVVLTGAGISTESGIPDYRSEKVGLYARSKYTPVDHGDFMRSEKWRKHYWARNAVGWLSLSKSTPNVVHNTIAAWENSEKFNWLITQNVDGLHTLAGSKNVTEIHGCGRRVKCMNCNGLYSREEMEKWITELNPNWLKEEFGDELPTSDAPISATAEATFKIPECPHCGKGSILKTDVVFFGDCLSMHDIELCYQKVESSTGMLVLGSSLVVNSGYQFVHHASMMGIPILIVNIGETAGDHIATMKLSANCSDIVKLIPTL